MGKSLTALQKHKNKECDCYINNELDNKNKNVNNINDIQNKCNYQPFLDGWDFIGDAGNAQNRGEIFTPKWIVDKMITNILPKEAVYNQDYSNSKLDYITNKVNEPAVGTANFTSTILYHKLEYAYQLSLVDDIKSNKESINTLFSYAKLDLKSYHINFLTAIASIYAYDIDVGNLEVTKRRLLSHGKHPLNDEETIAQWTLYLMKWINQDINNKKISYQKVNPMVRKSLDEAKIHWQKFVKTGNGIIDNAYYKATGQKMPNWLYEQVREILYKNIKLFNGIKEVDTLDWKNQVFIPGYKNVSWTWWAFEKSNKVNQQPIISEKLVSLKAMMLNSELENLQQELIEKQELSKQKLENINLKALENKIKKIGLELEEINNG